MTRLKIFLMLLLLIPIFSSVNVYAKSYAGRFYEEGWQTSKVGVFAKEKGGRLDYNGWYVRSTKDKNIYYCIEPNTTLEGSKAKSHSIITGKSNMIKNSKLTNSKYKRVNLLAYYGYGYKQGSINHNNKKWYGITQVMIWRTMRTDLSWNFKTSRYGNASSSLFKKEVKEMNNLVDNHSKKPSFAGVTKTISNGQSITLKDTNGVLELYDITSKNSNVKLNKSGNNLKITGIKNGIESITFKKKCNVNNNVELFTSKTYQDLIKKGSFEDITFEMKAQVITSNLTIQKEDSETGLKPQNNLSFKDATYEVLDQSNKKVGTLKTNEKGVASIDLPNGTYTLREVKAPIGYNVNTKIVKITINNKNEKVIVKDELINGTLIIEKEKGSKSEGFVKEKGASFEIYNSDNKLVDTIVTDESGISKIKLPYGKYKIKQTKGEEGYSTVSDFEVNINEQKEYKYNLKNEKYSKLVFTKTDFSTKKSIPNTLIEIYTDDNKLIFNGRTDKEGKILIEKLKVGKYYILEKDAPKYYLLNKEKMPFEVKQNGEVIKCNMENHRKTGMLVINKIDELEKTPLKGAKFEVVFTENNKKIFTGITDERGKLEIKDLIAGKYCINETKAPNGYKGIKDPICFEIDKQNQTKEIEITNTKNLLVPDTYLKDNKQKILILIITSLIGVSFIVYETVKSKKRI